MRFLCSKRSRLRVVYPIRRVAGKLQNTSFGPACFFRPELFRRAAKVPAETRYMPTKGHELSRGEWAFRETQIPMLSRSREFSLHLFPTHFKQLDVVDPRHEIRLHA